MKRINIVGTSGSGKTTFSRMLAQRLGVPCIEMDFLFWRPNWEEPDDDEFFPIVKKALSGDTWVLDGNYSRTTPIKWERVDTVIWLDYGFFRTLFQIIKRSIRRAWSQEELWKGTGNKESFIKSFFSTDSVIWWMLKSYKKMRIRYLKIMEDESYKYIRFIHLRSPRESRRFLENLGNGGR